MITQEESTVVIDIVTPTQGAYLFQVHLRGSLIEIEGGRGAYLI